MYLHECDCIKKKNVFEALYKTQEACKGIEADAQSTGPSKHKYLSLTGVYNAVKPFLKEHGLFVHHQQCTDTVTGKQIQRTIIKHKESGEEIVDERYLVPDKPGSQGAGSAETYMKRYALVSLIGIATGENDDDGEAGREYFQRIKIIQDLIKKHANKSVLWQDIVATFKIKNLNELNDGRLFDVYHFIQNYK